MIIVKLWGGIGNQLFQYVFGQYLRHHYNEDVRYDSNAFYEVDKLRKLELAAIDTDISYDNRCGFSKYRGLRNRLRRLLFQLHPHHHFIKEGQKLPQRFNPSHLYYMQGYWQDLKYYQTLKEYQPSFILRSLIFPVELSNVKDTISVTTESVSVHVRRGDYFSSKNVKTYGVCDASYYVKALEVIRKQFPNAVPYVFSDDLDWVLQHLDVGSNAVLVPNLEVNQFAYIELMAQCKHHIISNSSFSWWGAVIGEHEDSIVVAPSRWTMTSKITLALEQWIKIAV